jgi:hypothetical protein
VLFRSLQIHEKSIYLLWHPKHKKLQTPNIQSFLCVTDHVKKCYIQVTDVCQFDHLHYEWFSYLLSVKNTHHLCSQRGLLLIETQGRCIPSFLHSDSHKIAQCWDVLTPDVRTLLFVRFSVRLNVSPSRSPSQPLSLLNFCVPATLLCYVQKNK